MKKLTRRQINAALAGGLIFTKGCRQQAQMVRRELKYLPAPVDNPMKGFVPFAGDWGDAFPHSMEWAYFPLNAIMKGPGRFDFGRFEKTIAEIAGRGHQTALRVYLDYPKRPTGVPRFLIDAGLRMTRYEDHGGGVSPDYRNEDLITALTEFIEAFGEQYDTDGRIAYITLGLLGFWGEWHTFPLSGLMADLPTQQKIMTAYAEAFSHRQLLMRYPHDDAMAWPIGLHDDSFTQSTIGPNDWEFLRRIEAAGAENLWKTRPIGGEVRPEVQSFMWKEPELHPPGVIYQDFGDCVRSTHGSWFINHSLFRKRPSDGEYERALEGARLLGYELQLLAVETPRKIAPGKPVPVTLEIRNRGVAPLYAEWKIGIRVEGGEGTPELLEMPWELREILPDSAPQKGKVELLAPDPLPPGGLRIRLIPPQPFIAAPPLRFANAGLEPDATLVLAEYGSEGSLL